MVFSREWAEIPKTRTYLGKNEELNSLLSKKK